MTEDQVPGSAFEFTGSGGEYFRIWSVNLLLTVLTLGIYSAWAKVRREQYFHRNTVLAGSGFDYHGNPRAILKGRLIAWGLLALLGVAQKFSPSMYGLLILASLPLMPWLLLRSIKFRAANTSYRGLRFRHRGTYRQALVAYLGHGLLTLLSLGLWLPQWMRAMKRFQIAPLSYGTTDFACTPRAGAFYGAYLRAALLLIAPLAAAIALVVLAAQFKGHAVTTGAVLLGVGASFIFVLAMLLLVRPFLRVRLANITWNATRLGGRSFASTQALRSYFPLVTLNVVLTLMSFGLYWPWATVRDTAYRLRRLAFDTTDIDAFLAHAEAQTSAVGEEIADVFDLDIAL